MVKFSKYAVIFILLSKVVTLVYHQFYNSKKWKTENWKVIRNAIVDLFIFGP